MDRAEQDTVAPGDDGGAFHFVGDALALDLANTEVAVRGKRRDLLAPPGTVARWWRAAQAVHPDHAVVRVGGTGSADEEVLRVALVTLRSSVRASFGALAAGSVPATADIERLNAALATGRQALEIPPGGEPRLVYRATDPVALVVLPIALSALDLITGGDRGRLRRCANDRCVLLFRDTTKSATRRWCSVGCKDRDRKMKGYRRRTGEA
jgi:predicted RNA-binding Zn ribbon-like protein